MAKSTSPATVVAQAAVEAAAAPEASVVAAVEQTLAPPAAEQWRDKLFTSRVLVVSEARTARVVAGRIGVEPADDELRAYLEQHPDFALIED